MTVADRRDLHAKIALHLQSPGAEERRLRPDLIAHHLRESGDVKGSLGFRLQAGRSAVESAAYAEATAQFDAGLADIATLPAGPEGLGLELEFLRNLIGPLAAARGFSAPKFGECGRRGLELAKTLHKHEQVGVFLYAQFTSAISRGDVPLAKHHAEKFEQLTAAAHDATGLVIAHRSLGMVLLSEGHPESSARALEQSLRLYEEGRDQPQTNIFAQDARITGKAVLALVCWIQGRLADARRIGAEAVKMAEALRHPLSIAIALSYYGGMVMGYSRLPGEVERYASGLAILSREYRLRAFEHYAAGWRGLAHLQRGEVAAAIADLSAAVAGLTEIEWLLSIGNFELWLAEAYAGAGRLDEATAACDRVIARAARGAERWYLSEAYRVRAKALHARGESQTGAAIGDLCSGADIARNMPSPSFELRCLEDLARLLSDSAERSQVEDRIGLLKLGMQVDDATAGLAASSGSHDP